MSIQRYDGASNDYVNPVFKAQTEAISNDLYRMEHPVLHFIRKVLGMDECPKSYAERIFDALAADTDGYCVSIDIGEKYCKVMHARIKDETSGVVSYMLGVCRPGGEALHVGQYICPPGEETLNVDQDMNNQEMPRVLLHRIPMGENTDDNTISKAIMERYSSHAVNERQLLKIQEMTRSEAAPLLRESDNSLCSQFTGELSGNISADEAKRIVDKMDNINRKIYNNSWTGADFKYLLHFFRPEENKYIQSLSDSDMPEALMQKIFSDALPPEGNISAEKILITLCECGAKEQDQDPSMNLLNLRTKMMKINPGYSEYASWKTWAGEVPRRQYVARYYNAWKNHPEEVITSLKNMDNSKALTRVYDILQGIRTNNKVDEKANVLFGDRKERELFENALLKSKGFAYSFLPSGIEFKIKNTDAIMTIDGAETSIQDVIARHTSRVRSSARANAYELSTTDISNLSDIMKSARSLLTSEIAKKPNQAGTSSLLADVIRIFSSPGDTSISINGMELSGDKLIEFAGSIGLGQGNWDYNSIVLNAASWLSKEGFTTLPDQALNLAHAVLSSPMQSLYQPASCHLTNLEPVGQKMRPVTENYLRDEMEGTRRADYKKSTDNLNKVKNWLSRTCISKEEYPVLLKAMSNMGIGAGIKIDITSEPDSSVISVSTSLVHINIDKSITDNTLWGMVTHNSWKVSGEIGSDINISSNGNALSDSINKTLRCGVAEFTMPIATDMQRVN